MSIRAYLLDFVYFCVREARAAAFAGSFLALLVFTHLVPEPLGVARADFLFVMAVLIQATFIWFRLETVDEAKAIALFHMIGLALELYKTHPAIGSWSYADPGFFHIAHVPLYTGFMYAAVGSYVVQAWKTLHLRIERHPPYVASGALCVAIYINFFTNHFVYDARIVLIALVFLLYRKTVVHFTPRARSYRMPLTLGFALVGFFVWLAENIGTYTGAWTYPNQVHAWNVVSFQKISSWFLLVIICFITVAVLKRVKEGRAPAQRAVGPIL